MVSLSSSFILLAGLITGISLTLNNIPWYMVYTIFTIPFIFILKNKRVIFFSLGIITGFITTTLHISTHYRHLPDYIDKAEGIIVSTKPSNFSTEYTVKIKNILQNNEEKKVSEKILLKVRDRQHLSYIPGTCIILEDLYIQNIPPPKNPAGFDYRNYLKRKCIYFEGKTESISLKEQNNLLLFFQKIRKSIIKKIDAKFLYFPEEKELLKTITLGQEDIPDFLKQIGIRSGTYHILVISGLHIGFLLLLLEVLFIPFAELKNRYPKLFPSIALIILWFYAGLTGFKIPVLRAVLMVSFFFLGEVVERDVDIISSIFVAAFILLVINPYNILDVSFQLSFLITLGIVLFWHRFKPTERNLLKTLFLTSVAAQIAAFPLMLYHFGSFYPLGLVNNIIFIPLACATTFLSFLSFIIPFLFLLLRILLTLFLRGITLSSFISPAISVNFSIPLVIAFYTLPFLLFYHLRKKFITTVLYLLLITSIPAHFLLKQKNLPEDREILYILSLTRPSAVYIKDNKAICFLADHYRTREIEEIVIPLLTYYSISDLFLFYTSITYNHTATFNTLKKRFNIITVYEPIDIKNSSFFPYLDIYYHNTLSLFKFIPYGKQISLSGINVVSPGYENGTVSYIIKRDKYSILISPFTGPEISEQLANKFFDVAYIGDVKKTKKIMENLSSLGYNYLILPENYKKFEKLPEAKADTLYLKQSAVKVLCNHNNISVKYHYQK